MDTDTILQAFSVLGAFFALRFLLDLIYGLYATFVRGEKNFKKMGQWAVVTGATDGIGKAYAEALAKRGMDIVLVSRTQEKLDAVKADIAKASPSVKVQTMRVDFGAVDEKARAEIAKLCDRDVGVLINNVGVSYDHPMFFTELEDSRVDQISKLNIESVLLMTRAVLPGMEKRKRGAIVNISSASGLFPSPLLSQYSGSKSFVELFTRGLAAEVRPLGVHMHVQSPLYVTTKLAKKRHPTWDTPSPRTYVNCALRHIGHDSVWSSPYWAHALQIWLICHIPERMAAWIVGKMHHMIRKAALRKKAKKAE